MKNSEKKKYKRIEKFESFGKRKIKWNNKIK